MNVLFIVIIQRHICTTFLSAMEIGILYQVFTRSEGACENVKLVVLTDEDLGGEESLSAVLKRKLANDGYTGRVR